MRWSGSILPGAPKPRSHPGRAGRQPPKKTPGSSPRKWGRVERPPKIPFHASGEASREDQLPRNPPPHVRPSASDGVPLEGAPTKHRIRSPRERWPDTGRRRPGFRWKAPHLVRRWGTDSEAHPRGPGDRRSPSRSGPKRPRGEHESPLHPRGDGRGRASAPADRRRTLLPRSVRVCFPTQVGSGLTPHERPCMEPTPCRFPAPPRGNAARSAPFHASGSAVTGGRAAAPGRAVRDTDDVPTSHPILAGSLITFLNAIPLSPRSLPRKWRRSRGPFPPRWGWTTRESPASRGQPARFPATRLHASGDGPARGLSHASGG